MKTGTEGLANPDSNMVAPPEEDRENPWIQVQSKKSRRIARKKQEQNTFLPTCKHHASPDSLINIDSMSDNDSASYADVLIGKVKPSKTTGKRSLNLTPKHVQENTVTIDKQQNDDPSVSSSISSNSDEELFKHTSDSNKNKQKSTMETALAARNQEASYNKFAHKKMATKHPSTHPPTHIHLKDQCVLQKVHKQYEVSQQNEHKIQQIKNMLEPLLCTDPRLLSIKTIANDLSHINDKQDHKTHIQEELPKLFDRVLPISSRVLAYKHKKLTRNKAQDWQRYGIERMTELLRFEQSMFGHSLIKNGYMHSFRELYQELDDYYDTWAIPYRNRKPLFVKEIEQISLLIFDILPENYVEQGVWPNDTPQGRWSTFLNKQDNIHQARNKWLQLLGDDYFWFWQVYTLEIEYSTLSIDECVLLDDLYNIIMFIHPEAIQMILNDQELKEIYVQNQRKTNKERHWITTRHDLYYVWMFFGWRQLHKDLPFYSIPDQNDLSQLTKWIHKSVMPRDFLDFDLLYLQEELQDLNSPATYIYVQLSTMNDKKGRTNFNYFYPQTSHYNGVKTSKKTSFLTLKNIFPSSVHSRRNAYKKNIRVHVRRKVRARMKLLEALDISSYDNEVDINSKYLNASKYLPVDWLLWYDYVSESMRCYNFLYGYKLVTVPYFILKNGDERYDCETVRSVDHIPSELKLFNSQDVLTHTSPCTYLSYFPPVEITPRDGLPPLRISIIEDLYYNGSRGRNLKYNYVYGKRNHINNDFYTQENTYSEDYNFKNIYYQDTDEYNATCADLLLKKNQVHLHSTKIAESSHISITCQEDFTRNSKIYIPHLTSDKYILSDSDSNDSYSERCRIDSNSPSPDTRLRKTAYDQQGSYVLDIERSNELLVSGIFPLRRNGTYNDSTNCIPSDFYQSPSESTKNLPMKRSNPDVENDAFSSHSDHSINVSTGVHTFSNTMPNASLFLSHDDNFDVEFAYVTSHVTETDANNLNDCPVVSVGSVSENFSETLDASNLARSTDNNNVVTVDKNNNSNLMSGSITETDIDNSILNLTKTVKNNFLLATQEIDNIFRSSKSRKNSTENNTTNIEQDVNFQDTKNDSTSDKISKELASIKSPSKMPPVPPKQDDTFSESSITLAQTPIHQNTSILSQNTNKDISDDISLGSLLSSKSDHTEKSSSSSSTSVSSLNSNNTGSSSDTISLIKPKSQKLTHDKVCTQALHMIKILGTLNMRKLDLKHEPRLRRHAFMEWISQLEIAFSSNKYTRDILENYSTKNKINKTSSKLVDILIYTVAYAFLDKPTRLSTIKYKNKGCNLLKVLHLKCASFDENTKLRAKMAFFNCKITSEETAINFLTRLEQKANEARNYEIHISEHRFITVLLNNMKHHKFYKERIAAILTNFELNPKSISQPWLENKFYSLDEERLHFFRQRIRDSARYTTSPSLSSSSRTFSDKSKAKHSRIRCKYCYNTGHLDTACPDKSRKKPPTVPLWISKLTCAKCKKKGHMAFNCPPKYDNKILKRKNPPPRTQTDNAAHVTEFAGAARHHIINPNRPNNPNSNPRFYQRKSSYRQPQFISPALHQQLLSIFTPTLHHRTRQSFLKTIQRLKSHSPSHFNKTRVTYKNLVTHLQYKMQHITYDQALTLLWFFTKMNMHNKYLKNTSTKRQSSNTNNNYSSRTTPHRSSSSRLNHHRHSAFHTSDDCLHRNVLPASNLAQGWIIDSGASAHMTPFYKDCKNIQPTQRTIFLADGSTVLCNKMGTIHIPIKKHNKHLGTLKLEDVLIVPNLDRRLFSVGSFLAKGNNWVHFTRDSIELGIKGGPKLIVPITSLQTNAMVVNVSSKKQSHPKYKLSTEILHSRLHRSHGAFATVKAHNLWLDVDITQGTDQLCTSCKMMSIPAASRRKTRTSHVTRPLEEIQLDTVPNPEPLGLSSDSRYSYYLIFCDRYSRIFRICGIRDKTTDACIDGINLIISSLPIKNKHISHLRHIRSDAGSEFRSDTFRKWCSDNKIEFSSAAPKHQEQNGLVERHWGTICKLANTMMIHARLNRKFFYYAVLYAQFIHDVIPIKDLKDASGLPTTPYFLGTNTKPNVRHFRVFGCPAIFKKYDFSSQGKRATDKYSQQGVRGIFVGFPTDSAGWLFYVPDANRTYISMDAVFDENFTSPLHLPTLPYQGAVKLRSLKMQTPNTETITEFTGPPHGLTETFPKDLHLLPPLIHQNDMSELTRPEPPKTRSKTKMSTNSQAFKTTTVSSPHKSTENENKMIQAYFTNMSHSHPTDNKSEYLYTTHELNKEKLNQEKQNDTQINLSDFIPEPRSLNHVIRLSPHTKEKWGSAISKEVYGLFDNDTFDLSEAPLPTDEIVPVKLALKAKLNAYGGLDKLKARICLRGDMQVKDGTNTWSPTASSRLLKCFMADAISNGSMIYQLDFIQAFIQSNTKKRIFVLLDQEYEAFCPKLREHFGRPLRLRKCLYGADFSGKFWYETLNDFLVNSFGFKRSRAEGCLYIYRNGDDWVKMINYVDDALYYASSHRVREHFEISLKNKFNLTLLGIAKWYLGMRIIQKPDYITLDQDQYIKNITSRFEKLFKHPFKLKDSPLPSTFVPSKKDCPVTDEQTKEIKIRFGNINFRSIIGALLYVSCCTRPDISYAVNKLAKYATNPGISHFRAIIHLIGFIKSTSNKRIKFFKNFTKSPLYKILIENNILDITAEGAITFSDSSWNDCIDTGRSTGGYISSLQGGVVDYGSHLPVPVAMSSGEAEYIAAAVACMRASHLRMLIYDLQHMSSRNYNATDVPHPPAKIIIDNEAAIAMATCNKDTAGNRHVARRYHYVRQGTSLKEHTFSWIGTKHQLADILTKPGTPKTFSHLWNLILFQDGE